MRGGNRTDSSSGDATQMGKIDKFTKSQLSTLKKRVKSLREQVKDVKEGEGNSELTQVSDMSSGARRAVVVQI